MNDTSENLLSGFLCSAQRFPQNTALVVDGVEYSYDELKLAAQSISNTLLKYAPVGGSDLTAVFAYRSKTIFEGILASLYRGHGYVPLNCTFPEERTKTMLIKSNCRSLIVDSESANQLDVILDGLNERMLIVLPEITDVNSFSERWPKHIFIGANDLEISNAIAPIKSSPDSVAYLLFTSGSTGDPKGVMVSHHNVMSFVSYIVGRYEVTETDRLSQMFDMTFDLSVFDMFIAWQVGACVCCPTRKTLLNPGKYIQDMKLTLWLSVPSTAIFMKRFRMLKPGKYQSLKWSLFCGEPLPKDIAELWLQAAPNSTLENLYGPTELTIACTLYRWDLQHSPQECEFGIVPIGYPFPEMNVMVVNEDLKEVEPGEEGELLMNGPQMTLGYWQDPQKTAKAFVKPYGVDEIYYRTGDRVRKPLGQNPLTYLGRVDFQVKIQGHRVELGEIEAVVREVSGYDGVVAIGWPITSCGAQGVEVFIEGDQVDTQKLYEKVSKRLPEYMVPKRYHLLNVIPLNANGKYDRKSLLQILESI